jgi:3',5'-cyclic AMP phosphodiesterase CpdA
MLIAHLTDMHLLERAERQAFDVRFVSLGRRLDAEDRLSKARRAIETARAAGADHYVFTGDLTETGTPAQLEVLAELLFDCNLRPDDVTLLPGNHDAYTSPGVWREALSGSLRAFARNAALEPGKVTDLGGVWLLPVDATFHQPVTRSAARFNDEIETALAARLADPALASAPVVIAIHHPPHPRPGPWHWVDGLLGGKRLLSMIEPRENVMVLHGHLHKAIDRQHGSARVVGGAAIVDGASATLHAMELPISIERVA